MKSAFHRSIQLIVCLITVIILPVLPLPAQLVADGATNTLSNVATNITGDVTVGTNGSFTLLALADNAALTNTGNGIIGLNVTARSNEVRLTSASSRWVMTGGSLFVGSNGSFNRLVVSNGALVQHVLGIGALGHAFASSNNEVIVTGSDSLWNIPNHTLQVGASGNGNRLVVSNGGGVRSFAGMIGASSTNNEVLITGPGSFWTNPANLTMSVSAGSANNRLVLSNGGSFFTAAGVTVGGSPSSSNSRLVVDGGLLRATNATGTGLLDVRRGSTVLDAGTIDVDQLFLTNALGFLDLRGGTLITRGALITGVSPFVVGSLFSKSAVWDVRAGASNHVLTSALSLGHSSSLNQLLVTNGALFSSAGGFLGLNSFAISNTAVIAGPGSTWSNTADLEIGSSSPGSASRFNALVVSNGGFVHNASGTLGSLGGNNLALVTGAGSVWSNSSALTLGLASASNHLVVSDGGMVRNDFAFVSFGFDSSNNLATVTGSNAVWQTVNQLNFGYAGPGNQLVVSNGGTVLSDFFALGVSPSRSNVALVTGSGSVLSNSILLYVGEGSAGNRLTVANGGRAQSVTAFVGFQNTSSNNLALVTDPGSTLNSDVILGSGGARNQLVVSNGAVAQSSFSSVGSFASGSNNLAVVTGPGSVWSNAVELLIGVNGRSNRLVVSNGALLTAGTGFIGRHTNANQNSVILTGPGTRWLVSSNLYVGSNGAFGLLVVSNAAQLASSNAWLGVAAAGRSNVTLVTGAGTAWSNRAELTVGNVSLGNRLVVSNGATVFTGADTVLGANSGANSNTITVTDPGSLWAVGGASFFYAGRNGAFNRLIISNGGGVRSFFGAIGSFGSGGTNEAVVTGPGSHWSLDSGFLFIGDGSNSGNRLVISDGGRVVNDSAHVGFAATNCEALVTGPGSVWTNRVELRIGNLFGENRLVVSNGASVVVSDLLSVGALATSLNNRVVVDGGTLLVTNVAGTAVLDIRRGTNVLNAGLIEADILRMTNGTFSKFDFNSGLLSVKSSRVSTGPPLIIGNGSSPATLHLAGNGTHDMTGTLGLIIRSNATLSGSGSLLVQLQLPAGATLSPGASIGRISVNTAPFLSGTVVMEISKNGSALTNDQFQVTGTLTYGGSLIVSDLGPTTLAAGDAFPLFSASSYAGGFTNTILPPLPAGLDWTNKLLLNGSIEVVALPVPQFTSITVSGTNVIVTGTNGLPDAPYFVLASTNVALPMSNWVSIATNLIDSSGNFSFTNSIALGELQRYFRIRTP